MTNLKPAQDAISNGFQKNLRRRCCCHQQYWFKSVLHLWPALWLLVTTPNNGPDCGNTGKAIDDTSYALPGTTGYSIVFVLLGIKWIRCNTK